MADFEPIGEIAVEAAEARVFEHGWQSWSPSSTDAARAAPRRPTAATPVTPFTESGAAAGTFSPQAAAPDPDS
ncbi:MAG: hypothetical protein ABIZ72_02225 [Candidatus Limnocylindrales bacterium]